MSAAGLTKPADWKPAGIVKLEPDALAAVQATGNTLVTAGPGAGKTELLGQRGVFLLQTGVCAYPRRLLAISFKRDAAKNLRERFQRRCTKEQAGRLDSLTFDAFAKLLLDRFWRAIPEPWRLSDGYTISRMLNRNEFNEFLRSAADGVSNPQHAAHWVATYVGNAPTKNQILAVTQDEFNLSINELTLLPLTVPTAAAFVQMVHFREAASRKPAALTFPMIGRLAQLIIASNPKIRAAFLATYSHLFMDEFQDTTGVQYGLMKTIFGDSDTVATAVGDDKQKIMGWAGAQKDGFGLFQQDFLKLGKPAGQQHITLSLNYRSNARIVEILNTLKRRLAPSEPDFVAARPAPELPPEQICSVVLSPDSAAEAAAIASFVATEITAGVSPRNIGLLVRQKAVDWEAVLGPALTQHGVTLRNEDRDVGGASIQDLMTEPYAQAVIDTLDLLLRKRGGVFWVRVLDVVSGMEGLAGDDEPERMQEVVAKLDSFHGSNRIEKPDAPASPEDVAKWIVSIEGFLGLAALKALAPQYQQGDFFERVRVATKTFLVECTNGGANWHQVISRYRGENQVPLLTITKSKGLEYDIVLLLGLDDQQWWSFKNNPNEGHSTFFVAASRARERLFLTICKGQQTAKITEIYGLLRDAGVKIINSADWKSR